MTSARPNAFFFLARHAWRYAGAERWRMAVFYGLCIAANVFLIFQPVVLAQIVNAVQAGGADLVAQAVMWCAVYAGLIVAFWACHGPSRVMERRLAFVVYRRFITSMYRKVTEMPLRWHQDHHTGDTINRVTKAGKALYRFAQEQFIPIQLTVRFAGSLAVLFWYSWWVAVTAATLSTALFIAIRRFDSRLIPLIGIVNDREHKLTAGLFDYIGNIVTVMTLRLEKSTHREIRRRFLGMRHPHWREVVLNEVKWFIVNVVLIFMQAGQVGAYIALTLWLGKPLDIGSVVAVSSISSLSTRFSFKA